MIGGEALVRSLVASGVDVVFANPGTSEMHFVATLDAVPEMRGVLALFEGAATGAADGYARMRETPAAVLLHLGPGDGRSQRLDMDPAELARRGRGHGRRGRGGCRVRPARTDRDPHPPRRCLVVGGRVGRTSS
jgi:hypothetical protein